MLGTMGRLLVGVLVVALLVGLFWLQREPGRPAAGGGSPREREEVRAATAPAEPDPAETADRSPGADPTLRVIEEEVHEREVGPVAHRVERDEAGEQFDVVHAP